MKLKCLKQGFKKIILLIFYFYYKPKKCYSDEDEIIGQNTKYGFTKQ